MSKIIKFIQLICYFFTKKPIEIMQELKAKFRERRKRLGYTQMYFNDTILSSGTAVLIADDKNSHCSLMTNRHNVTGKNQETGKHLDKNLSEPNYILIYFHKNTKDKNEWKKVKLPLYRDDETP